MDTETIENTHEQDQQAVELISAGREKIEKELAGQEIPMLLTSTPGVYATQKGGGDGDVRINIRGFNKRNVAMEAAYNYKQNRWSSRFSNNDM